MVSKINVTKMQFSFIGEQSLSRKKMFDFTILPRARGNFGFYSWEKYVKVGKRGEVSKQWIFLSY